MGHETDGWLEWSAADRRERERNPDVKRIAVAEERIAELEAQVSRLKDYAEDLAAHLSPAQRINVPDMQNEHLQPGDLDPIGENDE